MSFFVLGPFFLVVNAAACYVVYRLGAIAAGGASALSGRPVPVAYVVTFAPIGLGTAAIGAVERRAAALAGGPGEARATG